MKVTYFIDVTRSVSYQSPYVLVMGDYILFTQVINAIKWGMRIGSEKMKENLSWPDEVITFFPKIKSLMLLIQIKDF